MKALRRLFIDDSRHVPTVEELALARNNRRLQAALERADIVNIDYGDWEAAQRMRSRAHDEWAKGLFAASPSLRRLRDQARAESPFFDRLYDYPLVAQWVWNMR